MKSIITCAIGASLVSAYAATALENPRIVPFDSDAATGISSNKTYTHAVDFGTVQHEAPLTINGVEFFTTTTVTMPGDKTPRGYGWEGFPHAVNHPDPEKTMLVVATPKGEKVRDLLLGHTWSLSNKYMYITDLKPGTEYEVRFYNRVYGAGIKRGNTFVFYPQGTGPDDPRDLFSFNQDDQSVKDNMLVYRYRAGASGKLAIYVECWDTVYTWHCYGFTNEELPQSDKQSDTTDADPATKQ